MPATSYTLATLRSAMQTAALDPTGKYNTAAICLDRINLALAQVAQDTSCRRATTTITVNAGQAVYSLTSVAPRVIDVLRVALPPSENDTAEQLLTFLTMEEIDGIDFQWRSTTGDPTAYMRWGDGFTALRLYPEPTSTYTAITDASAATFSDLYGGIIDLSGLTDSEFDALYGGVIDAAYKYGSLRVDYVASSTDLANNSDSVETVGGIPVQYQDAVFYYAMFLLSQIQTPVATAINGDQYMALYQAEVAKCRQLSESSFQSKPLVESAGSFF